MTTLHGMHVRGFPNCFVMNNPQSGFTASYPHLLNEQAKHIAYIIQAGRDKEVRSIEVSPEGETEWVETCLSKARNVGDFFENCTPGYYNNEGKPGEGPGWFGGTYAGGAQGFFKILREWRAQGELEGLELS